MVLLAGWDDEVNEEMLRGHGVDAVLRKPFPVGAVLNLIHGLRLRRAARGDARVTRRSESVKKSATQASGPLVTLVTGGAAPPRRFAPRPPAAAARAPA